MRKLGLVVLLVFVIMSVGQIGFAQDDTGIQIIGGPEAEQETICLDDFKVGDTAVIDGYGEIGFSEVSWCANLLMCSPDTHNKGVWENATIYEPDLDAKFLQMEFDILNTQKEPFNFYEDFSDIICTYDDEYQFGGWVRELVVMPDESEALSDKADGSPVNMMYRREYSIVVTLPTDVCSRVRKQGKPLTVSFMLGDSEFTYIWRETDG